MPTASIPGFISGITICVMVLNRLHPSTLAASSRDWGTESQKDFIIQTDSGRDMATSASISP